MSYPFSELKSISEPGPRRLQELEEQRHTLLEICEENGQCIAKFPNGDFAFPAELEERLRELVGHKIGILRLEGYRVRDLGLP